MKFLIDAQLPYRLKYWLIEKGFETIHTRDLPEANEIRRFRHCRRRRKRKSHGNFKGQRFFETAHPKRQTAKTSPYHDRKHH